MKNCSQKRNIAIVKEAKQHCKQLILSKLKVKLRKTYDYFQPGRSNPMASRSVFLRHCFLLDRKVKKLIQRNLQSFGNLIDHASSHIVFPAFNPSDLLTGISNNKSKVLLGHISCQSEFAHPVSKGFQKIFVYHILHIQEWKFQKDHKSPCMGYFCVFDYFCFWKEALQKFAITDAFVD